MGKNLKNADLVLRTRQGGILSCAGTERLYTHGGLHQSLHVQESHRV